MRGMRWIHGPIATYLNSRTGQSKFGGGGATP